MNNWRLRPKVWTGSNPASNKCVNVFGFACVSVCEWWQQRLLWNIIDFGSWRAVYFWNFITLGGHKWWCVVLLLRYTFSMAHKLSKMLDQSEKWFLIDVSDGLVFDGFPLNLHHVWLCKWWPTGGSEHFGYSTIFNSKWKFIQIELNLIRNWLLIQVDPFCGHLRSNEFGTSTRGIKWHIWANQ